MMLLLLLPPLPTMMIVFRVVRVSD